MFFLDAYIYIKKSNQKGIKQMSKNLLSENMLRFGTKNLSEGAKRNLVLESVMQTIKEHGLYNEVKRRLMEFAAGKDAQSIKDGLWDAFSSFGKSNLVEVVNNLQYIQSASEFNAVNKIMFDSEGMGIISAIAKYCPGEEVKEVPAGKETNILDEMTRIWYPGTWKAAVAAHGAKKINADQRGMYYFDAGLFNKSPFNQINTDTTTWQKTKRQMTFTKNRELRSGGGAD